jgi:hypothetical protein
MPALDAVMESVIAQSLQDARALSVRAQDSAAKFHDVIFANVVALQQQASQKFLQLGFDNSGVEAAYRGSHLKMGSEVDVQQAASEGQVVKDQSQASLPITQAQHSANFLDLHAKVADLTALVGQLVKAMQTTPPQSGGHAAEAPSALKP